MSPKKIYLTLDQLKVHQKCRVHNFLDTYNQNKFMEMGIVFGCEIELLRRAPMGDPLVFQIDTYLLSLRAEDACNIVVILL